MEVYIVFYDMEHAAEEGLYAALKNTARIIPLYYKEGLLDHIDKYVENGEVPFFMAYSESNAKLLLAKFLQD